MLVPVLFHLAEFLAEVGIWISSSEASLSVVIFVGIIVAVVHSHLLQQLGEKSVQSDTPDVRKH